MSARTSSSVTDAAGAADTGKIFRIESTEMRSNHTSGNISLANTAMIGATAIASDSAWVSAMRFGTNSPNTNVQKVTKRTTAPKASSSEMSASTPRAANHPPRASANVAPLYTPVSMPMSVMPTCTADRNVVESASRSSAKRAPRLPRSADDCSRPRLADTKAISASAKKPLSSTNSAMISDSAINIRRYCESVTNKYRTP